MKSLMMKKIILMGFILVLVGNIFTTNIHTFNTKGDQCHVQDIHHNPCLMVHVGDSIIEIEQEDHYSVSSSVIAFVDFEFISLIQETVVPQQNISHAYIPRDLSPPWHNQLARSNI